jgi:hypothetical protein
MREISNHLDLLREIQLSKVSALVLKSIFFQVITICDHHQ